MIDNHSIIEKGKEVVRIEAQAVAELGERIGQNFADAVELICNCKGRVIITGVGKSGIIARKIVATMNSTGTPAFFLHPSDAVHGDLGMVRQGDVVVCISKSGDTPELHGLLPMFKRIGVSIVSLVGKMQSKLAVESDIVLDASVREEACPHDLAPTSSTTATLALGDALAIALLERREFSREDFALYHPGGSIGKRLLLKIDELMVTGDAIPRVTGDVPLKDAIFEMTTKRLGCTCVVRKDGTLEGVLTDGDLRRLLQRTSDITNINAAHAMTPKPKTILQGSLAVVALQEMESYNITQLIVVDSAHKPVGVVHLHDLVKAGLGEEEGT
ncbi:MAG TPA: D-arabinose 5-phosphate isomerase [Bacteroidetes bacterium]|jgi:arabinose-5-phosphate isomerase|nr:D-arabinose 5-phosphate isomerase [Bacteroidota bacterium]